MNSPKHVAIIMDGNGRWGIKKRNSRNYGHKKGLKTVEKIINAAIKKKIKYLTLFVFSTENWKRPIKEVKYLQSLLSEFVDREIKNLIEKKIKIKIIGKIKPFPKNLKYKLNNVEKLTKFNDVIQINMALNYGSRQEIIESVKKIKKNNLQVNVKNIDKYLYTNNIPEPEILIRTGNTRRISNFLLWQLIYTEIFFEKKMWPDFSTEDFYRILKKFKDIRRNFGGLND